MFNQGLWNEGTWNSSGAGIVIIVPEPPVTAGEFLPLHIVDMVQVRAALEAWNMLVINGLSDAMVANSDTVEDIELEARLLVGHFEYERLMHRARAMLHQAENLGILKDSDIANATTTSEITALLSGLNGSVDRDIYSAFFQGT